MSYIMNGMAWRDWFLTVDTVYHVGKNPGCMNPLVLYHMKYGLGNKVENLILILRPL